MDGDRTTTGLLDSEIMMLRCRYATAVAILIVVSLTPSSCAKAEKAAPAAETVTTVQKTIAEHNIEADSAPDIYPGAGFRISCS